MKTFVNCLDQQFRVALISDTHNLLRPSVCDSLKGVDLIVHAGDVGSADVLRKLNDFAPVCAVRGNTDFFKETSVLPITNCIEVGELIIYVIHDLSQLEISVPESCIDIVISGHTHKPNQFEKDGTLYVNPGSVGKRRFDYPISMAFLTVENKTYNLEFHTFNN